MFKVFDEKLVKEVFFKLEEDRGCVRLVLVDKCGDRITAGNILRIDKDGLHLNTSITCDAPFRLTAGDERIYIADDI